MRGLSIPCSSKNTWATYLSAIVAHTSYGGASKSAGSSSVAATREDALVDVGDGHDELDVVLGDERRERREVAGIVDPRHERHVVGVVERGRQPIEVGCDRRRAGPAERGHDVDALAGAGEENRCHGRRGYCLVAQSAALEWRERPFEQQRRERDREEHRAGHDPPGGLGQVQVELEGVAQ